MFGMSDTSMMLRQLLLHKIHCYMNMENKFELLSAKSIPILIELLRLAASSQL